MHTFKLIYTNDKGETVEFYGRPYRLISAPLGNVTADIQTQRAPYQHGVTLIDTLLQSVDIPIELRLTADNYEQLEQLKRRLIAVVNPTVKGTLMYVSDTQSKVIDVVPSATPFFADNKNNNIYQNAQLEFFAASGKWRDVNPNIIKLEDYTGNFRFPFRGPGIRFATRGDRRTVINDGDSPAPIKVRFVGNAVNPLLKNETTGEYIKVNYTIPDGFEMHINTADGNKTVELVDSVGTRTNVFNYIDLASTFFKLNQGDNVLSFITEGGQPDVYIEFYNHYLGV